MKIFLLLAFLAVSCQADPEQAVELGTVKWSRDLPATLIQAKESQKPIMLLFQEVPG